MNSPNLQYKFGNFILDPQSGVLLQNLRIAPLRGRAFKVLELLVINQGRMIHKSEFFEVIWKDCFVTDGNLTVAINSIRKVIDKEGQKFIETFSSRGYRFCGKVEQIMVQVEKIQPNETSSVLMNLNQGTQATEPIIGFSNINNFVQINSFNQVFVYFSNLTKFQRKH